MSRWASRRTSGPRWSRPPHAWSHGARRTSRTRWASTWRSYHCTWWPRRPHSRRDWAWRPWTSRWASRPQSRRTPRPRASWAGPRWGLLHWRLLLLHRRLLHLRLWLLLLWWWLLRLLLLLWRWRRFWHRNRVWHHLRGRFGRHVGRSLDGGGRGDGRSLCDLCSLRGDICGRAHSTVCKTFECAESERHDFCALNRVNQQHLTMIWRALETQ